MASTKHITADENDKSLSRLVLSLPGVRDAIKKRRGEWQSKRTEIAAQRTEALARREGPEAQRLAKALIAAIAAREKARLALKHADDGCTAAQLAVNELANQCERAVAFAERDLRASADPVVIDFVAQLYTSFNEMVNQGHRVTAGNPDAWAARIAALRDAIDAADVVRLSADADVDAEVQRIAATIPALTSNMGIAPAPAPVPNDIERAIAALEVTDGASIQ
jgi:hypothetical protein